MNPLLLVVALAVAQPMPKEVNLVVRPAEPPTPVLRVEILPPLLDQGPGECLALLEEANRTLKELYDSGQALPKIEDELAKARAARPGEVDLKQLQADLASIKKALDLVERAARARRCDWSKTTAEMRAKGIGARLDVLQVFRRLVPLLASRARLEVLQDRPEDAIRTVGLTLRLARRCGECPTLIGHLVGVAVFTIVVEQLDFALAHPKCPNLYWALTSLPQPLLSLRDAMAGERIGAYGTFPILFKFALDRDGPLPSEDEVKAFVRTGEETFRDLGLRFGGLERLTLGATIQFKHEMALKELTSVGFAEEKLRQWPPVLVAIVHGVVEYEEKLGRIEQTMSLPYPQAVAQLNELEKELKPRGPLPEMTAPAIHLSRLLLPSVTRVMMASYRVERRLAALRAVEALRLHASRTGTWPRALAEVEAVPVPLDPVTGEPFEYRVEGNVATLHGRLFDPKDPVYQELYYRLLLK